LDTLNEGESNKKSSLQIRTYFTRGQADELAAFFDEGFLAEALGKALNVDHLSDETPEPSVNFDSYDE
jgi:hypothetical protein